MGLARFGFILPRRKVARRPHYVKGRGGCNWSRLYVFQCLIGGNHVFRVLHIAAISAILSLMGTLSWAENFTFQLMTGEKINTEGQPTLIVNTAS
ncbi:MAG: hypothetical protein AAGH17_06215, partial [Pseudomonadota bacterium]